MKRSMRSNDKVKIYPGQNLDVTGKDEPSCPVFLLEYLYKHVKKVAKVGVQFVNYFFRNLKRNLIHVHSYLLFGTIRFTFTALQNECLCIFVQIYLFFLQVNPLRLLNE